jgi:Copper amine oxidase, enzyme domain
MVAFLVLKKYAAAGAIAVGAMLTANSQALALEIAETMAAARWNAQKEALPSSHISGCVPQTITFASGSAWSLCAETIPSFGLVISHASFRKTASSPFITVLFDGRWSSIFVVYQPGSPRFHDLQLGFSAATLGPIACPSTTSNPRVLLDGNTICREYRDTEIEWKVDFEGTHRVRRGVEVVYTAVLNAANYDYIQEWAFREDGTITPRAGSTGPTFFGPNDPVSHVHNFTWAARLRPQRARG